MGRHYSVPRKGMRGRKPLKCIHNISPKGECAVCRDAYQKDYREKLTTDRNRQYRLRYRFNLSPEQVFDMYEKQKGKCGLCGQPLIKFAIDHDHECCPGRICCGKCVRGLLCIPCNTMLGQISRIVNIGIKKVLTYVGIAT